MHQKLIKKSEPKIEENIANRVKLKYIKIAEIKKEEKNINNLLLKYYFTDYKNPSDMYKKLREKTDLKNEDQVYSIKEILGKTKKERKNEPETKNFIPNKEIINIVETILEFNRK